MHRGVWWGNLRVSDYLGDPDVDGGDNIKMDLQEVGWEGMGWIDLSQVREVGFSECADES